MNKPIAHTLTRPIRDGADLAPLLVLMQRRAMPYTVTIKDGLPRSTDQNRLQRLWCSEVSEQLGDRTPEQVRGYMKLHHGVPIRREDPEYDAIYRERIIHLPYEAKLALMMEPLDMPVSRDMTRKQLTRYLDAVYADFAAQGVVLTIPEPKR